MFFLLGWVFPSMLHNPQMGSPSWMMSHTLSNPIRFSSLGQLVCSEKRNWEPEMSSMPQAVLPHQFLITRLASVLREASLRMRDVKYSSGCPMLVVFTLFCVFAWQPKEILFLFHLIYEVKCSPPAWYFPFCYYNLLGIVLQWADIYGQKSNCFINPHVLDASFSSRESRWMNTLKKWAIISFLILDLFMNSCTCGNCIHRAAWEPSVGKGFCNIPGLWKPGRWTTRLQGRLCHSLFQKTNKQTKNPQPFDSSKCSMIELGVVVYCLNVS